MTFYTKTEAEKLQAFYLPLIVHQKIEDSLPVKIKDILLHQVGDEEFQLIVIATDGVLKIRRLLEKVIDLGLIHPGDYLKTI